MAFVDVYSRLRDTKTNAPCAKTQNIEVGMSRVGLTDMDRNELNRRLKAVNKEARKADDREEAKAVSDIYAELVGSGDKVVDPEVVLRVLDLCPRLHPAVDADGDRVRKACRDTLEGILEAGDVGRRAHAVMAASKVLARLCSDRDDDASSAREVFFRLLDHPSSSIEASLVVGTCLAKTLGGGEAHLDLLGARPRDSLQAVCLAEGVLNSVNVDNVDVRVLLVASDFVLERCSAQSAYAYQNFQSLKIFTAVLHNLARADPERCRNEALSAFYSPRSPTSRRIVQVISSNWENPNKGVPDVVGVAFANLLDAFSAADKVQCDKFVSEDLFGTAWAGLGWRSKAKYSSLVILLPRMGDTIKLLAQHPEVCVNLNNSLTSNYLASAGASVYRLLLKKLDFEEWELFLKNSVVEGLVSDDRLVSTNAANHWLNPTVARYKDKAANSLIGGLSVANCSDEKKLTSKMLVVKAAAQSGARLGEAAAGVASALRHRSSAVRGAAFSALCQSRRGSEPPSDEQMAATVDFVERNLIVDSPSFRQGLLSDLSSLLVRCRDNLVLSIRRDKEQARKSHLLRRLDELLDLLLSNLFPGANYQRLTTSLEVLSLLSFLFFHYRPGGVNKGSGNGDPADLVDLCREEGVFFLETTRGTEALLTCMLHHMSDVRERAEELLARFADPGSDVLESVATKAAELMCSAKLAECESGAGMAGLALGWGGKPELFRVQEAALKEALKGREEGTFSETFLSAYKRLLVRCDADFLLLSKTCPMHGLLTGVRACLVREQDRVKGDFASRLVQVLEKSSKTMLDKMSKKEDDGDGSMASFAEMGQAIDAIIEEDGGAADAGVEISDDHQLVLACSWLNLKECCLLASTLVKTCRGLTCDQASRCFKIVVGVLTGCRHKGAIISGQAAAQDISAALLNDSRQEFRAVPDEFLNGVLEEVSGRLSATSVTRRSAGLPMLVLKVVSGRPRTLLAPTVDRLLRTASAGEKAASSSSSETRDGPQVHALHILRALVHDSALAAELSPHVCAVTRVCVANFSSPSWAVRNAALQLFGALAPRMLGQKKVREESSRCNLITASEFLSRHSDVVPFLLEQLNEKTTTEEEENALVNPALVPLLSIMCRLSPSGTGDDGDAADSFRRAFSLQLGHPVVNVRRLAASAFAAFTKVENLEAELSACLRTLARNDLKANLINGLLHLSLKLLNATENVQVDGELLQRVVVTAQNDGRCCYENENLLRDVLIKCGRESLLLPDLKADSSRAHHPGFWRWREVAEPEERCERGDVLSATEEEIHRRIDALSGSENATSKLVDFLTEILESRQESGLPGGVLVHCFDLVATSGYLDPEAALELLEATSDERLQSTSSTSLSNSSLLASASATSTMLQQEDWDMFFGKDESPFVSRFVELTEKIGARCGGGSFVDEDARMCAGRALAALAPALAKRRAGAVPPVMRYGYVNVFNSALSLLSDEDGEVREEATKFAEVIVASTEDDDLTFSLSTYDARRRLCEVGLTELGDCLAWFDPVVEVAFASWRDDQVEVMRRSLKREYLFESGEGVNVYSESAFANSTYEKVIREHLSGSQGANMKNLGVDFRRGVEEARRLLDFCHEVDSKNGQGKIFSCLRTPCGHLCLVRALNFLRLVGDFPEELGVEDLDLNEVRGLTGRCWECVAVVSRR